MKKLFKQSILIATALMLSFTGCMSDPIIPDTPDIPGNSYEGRTIVLSVGQATDTRSVGDANGETPQIENNRYLDFQSGFLFLVDEYNNIVQHYTIGDYSGVTAVDATTRRIHRNVFARTYPNHSAPLVLPSVSHRVRNVVIIGNPATGLTISTTGNINTIVANTFSIMTQQNPLSVNLFGRTNGLTQTPSGDRYILTGTLMIGTSVARFEIPSIASDCTDIERFTIDGIFIDNHFQTARIDRTGIGTLNPASMLVEHYTQNSTRFPIHSWVNRGSTDNVITPATGRTWGYQVFAHSDTITVPPGIVIRLSNIQVRSGATPIPGVQFLAVSAFRKTNGDSLNNIDPRHVYRVRNLVFDRSNLSPIPNENLLSARVDVIVGRWQGEDVEWDRPVPGIGPPTDTTDPGVEINGIRWATRNLQAPNQFAAAPHSHGRYWQWGTHTNAGTWANAWEATQGADVAVPNWNSSTDRTAWTTANDPCPAGWRLPTEAEFIALNGNQFDNSHNVAGVSTWHDNWNTTGSAGRVYPAGATAAQITGATPTAIFLPVAGHRRESNGALIQAGGTWGYYWSSTPRTNNLAIFLAIGSYSSTMSFTGRPHGFNVRCIADPTAPAPNPNPDGVDIGGTVWATRNVNTPGTFVDNPEDFGMFYQWGRDIPWLTTGNTPVSVPAGATWETSSFQLSFATHWNNGAGPCPDGWRLPNRNDFTTLYNSGPRIWTEDWEGTNVNGYVFGTAPNQIFMPAAGHRFTSGLLNTSIEGAGGRGWYWTVGDGRQVSETDALTISYGSTIPGFQSSNRGNGLTVRCVKMN